MFKLSRSRQRTRKTKRQRPQRMDCVVCESLESRELMSANNPLFASFGGISTQTVAQDDDEVRATVSTETEETSTDTPKNVPLRNSLPGAAKTLYLDFDGHYQSAFVGCPKILGLEVCGAKYYNLDLRAFSRDDNFSAFSESEKTEINEIWRRVAEDFAPFNINVTTVNPHDFSNNKAMRIVIGDNSFQDGAAGVAYHDSFTNGGSNVAYVFANAYRDRFVFDTQRIAEGVSHEAGHTFGLRHQSLWENSRKVEEYDTGDPNAPYISGTQKAPIMGDSFDWYDEEGTQTKFTRGTWRKGTSSESFNAPGFGTRPLIQDDRDVLKGRLGY